MFYIPILVLAFLFFFRLHPFIPIFGNIFPDPYLVFFIFFILFLFFKTDWNKYKFKNLIPYFLILIAILSISFNTFRTPFFVEPTHTLNSGIDYVAKDIDNSFVILGDFGSKIQSKSVYSYLPTKYNVSTPLGWYPEVKNMDYQYGLFTLIDDNFLNGNYTGLREGLILYNVTDIISLQHNCDVLQSNGFKEKVKKDDVCLLSVQ
jgi:hypothetical protein